MQTETILGLNPKGFHKIAYHVWGEGRPGVPVICVHGLTQNGRYFDYLVNRLSIKRAVYCPDMAGRGKSDDLPDPNDYHFEQYRHDITALIARIGAAQIDWVGTSMGGILGMMLAALPNTPIRRLVLNDVGPIIPKQALDRIGFYVCNQPVFENVKEAEVYMRTIYKALGPLTDEDWDHLSQNSVRQTTDGHYILAYDVGIANAYRKQNETVDLWSIYDKIAAPTLLIRGSESDLLPHVLAVEMTTRGPCPKMVEFDGCGHAPALMSEEQTKVIEAFLEG